MPTEPRHATDGRYLSLGRAGILGAALLATFLGALVFQLHYFRGPAIPLAGIGLLAFDARRLTRHRILRPAVEMLSTIVVASAVLIWVASH